MTQSSADLLASSRSSLTVLSEEALLPGLPITVRLEMWQFLQIVQLLDRICFRRKSCRSLLASRAACNLNAFMLAQVVAQLP